MKIVWIAYNQAIGDEVNESLERCGVTNYIKIPVAHGVGQHSGFHMGSHIWPGVNSLLMIACTEETKDRLLEEVKKLKRSFEKEGIKVFVMPLDELV